jgi:hypothetical protein
VLSPSQESCNSNTNTVGAESNVTVVVPGAATWVMPAAAVGGAPTFAG